MSMLKFLFKTLLVLIIAVVISQISYSTSPFARQFIDARIQELKDQGVTIPVLDTTVVDSGVIVDPGNPGNPLSGSAIPSTILGKRLEYYRASKAELGVQE